MVDIELAGELAIALLVLNLTLTASLMWRLTELRQDMTRQHMALKDEINAHQAAIDQLCRRVPPLQST